MRNHEVTTVQPLLNKFGSINECGWSKSMIQVYNRNQIKASKFRIKEWDYYLIMNPDFGLALTISDDGYIGLQSASLLDFKNKWQHTETILNFLPMGKMNMPSSSTQGTSVFKNKRLHMEFCVEQGKRVLYCNFQNFYEGKPLICSIELKEPPMDSIVIATPWKNKKKTFYYNQKMNCMPAKGTIQFGEKTYTFDETTDFGTLDWGRGVWTYNNTWFWGSGSSYINGKPFGFNIGYGFGDTTAASENILFYDGIAHKLEDVEFKIPEDIMKPWKISSNNQRFEMEFIPLLDREAKISAVIISSDQHQVFGYLSGTAILDHGEKIEVKNMLCFLEKVHNKY